MSDETNDLEVAALQKEPLNLARVVDYFIVAKHELATYLGTQFLGGGLSALQAAKEFLLPSSDAGSKPSSEN